MLLLNIEAILAQFTAVFDWAVRSRPHRIQRLIILELVRLIEHVLVGMRLRRAIVYTWCFITRALALYSIRCEWIAACILLTLILFIVDDVHMPLEFYFSWILGLAQGALQGSRGGWRLGRSCNLPRRRGLVQPRLSTQLWSGFIPSRLLYPTFIPGHSIASLHQSLLHLFLLHLRRFCLAHEAAPIQLHMSVGSLWLPHYLIMQFHLYLSGYF